MNKICPYCKKEFLPKDSRQKFCSKECYLSYRQTPESKQIQRNIALDVARKYNHHIGKYTKVCKYCGKEFQTLNKNQEFCCCTCSGYYLAGIRKKNGWSMPSESKQQISKTFYDNFSNGLLHLDSVKKRFVLTKKEDIEKYIQINKQYLIEKNSPEECKVCGSLDCDSDICKIKSIRDKSKNLEKIGFDFSLYGSMDIIDEYYRIKSYITDLYWNQKLSFDDLSKKFSIASTTTIEGFFKIFNIERRNFSESSINSYLAGKNKIHQCNKFGYQYKHGWHTAWNNVQVYYRSSYELDYCLYLDQNKINYNMECIRLPYFNTLKGKICVAIPDFYIYEKNLLIEIKSDYTYCKQEMIDRFRSFKKYGYDYKLILEHVDYGKRLPEKIT